MSLHAELSPEAQAALEKQQRMSTISSILIAILSLVLIALVLMVLKMAIVDHAPEKVITYSAGLEDSEKITERKVTTNVERKPSAPSATSVKTIVANTLSPVAVPVPEVDVPDPAENYGLGDDFGEDWGDGDGDGIGGGGFAGIPPVMQKRCTPAERMERLLANGGTEQCEEAVVNGLRWLKSQQQEDGGWGDGKTWSKIHWRVGQTGVALLAFLGHCETPLSEEFGDTVTRAIVYLINNAEKNGGIMTIGTADRHWVYEHAVATYALAEAYTFCNILGISIPNLKETVKKAGEIIIERQHNTSGGWDYAYDQSGNRGGDLSIVGWHIQALKACSHTGIEFPGMRRTLKGAEDYVKARYNSDGGFGYSGKRGLGDFGYDTPTGVGVLSLQMLGKGSSREARGGLRYISERSKFEYGTKWTDLYTHYYEGQAMMNRGGKYWEEYNELFRDQLLDNQAEDGSWKPTPKNSELNAVAAYYYSPVYRTSLCVLMLEVYYRFLPATGDSLR